MISAPTENERTVTAMAEYIDREAAIAWFMPYVHAGESIEADVVISDLKGMKAADVEPVKIGRWIIGTGENGLQTGHRKCSMCGEIVKYGYSLYGVHNFCNYCGGKINEEAQR